MEFIISYGMPYSGTTVFAKALAKAIGAATVNSRAEGVWEIQDARPEEADHLLKGRWNPKTELVDQALINHWLSRVELYGKQYIVEKSPPLMFHRDSLLKLLPNTRELVLIRDPVQLYLSNRKRQKVDGRRLRTREEQLEKTTHHWTVNWFELYFRRLEKLSEILSDGVELVVYEDFVLDPAGYISSLSTLSGIPCEFMSNEVVVKGEATEKIEKRDKVPEEWLSTWEQGYIKEILLDSSLYKSIYQCKSLLQQV